MKPVEELPGVRKLIAGDAGGNCVPQSGMTYCVYASRKDGSTAHRHFQEPSKVREFRKQIMAEECRPGKSVSVTQRNETIEEFGDRWSVTKRPTELSNIRAPLNRVYRLVLGKPDAGRSNRDVGHQTLRTADSMHLEAVQAQLLDKYARNTVEVSMTYYKQLLRAAYRAGLLDRDVTVGVLLPRRDTLDDDGVVTDDDIPSHAERRAIIAGAPTLWRPGVALGFGCGMRVGEILGLQPEFVNFRAATLTVQFQAQRRGQVGPKTRNGRRTIEPPDFVMNELRRALRETIPRPPTGTPLYTGARGGKPRREVFYEKAWRPALRAAGLPEDRYKFHSTRHYCVSAMIENGVPTQEVARYVGDEVETVQRVYMHLLKDGPRKAKAALDRVFSDPVDAPLDGLAGGRGE